MRPQWAARYQGADLARQAALLILGIAQAHPFVDGNKRVAFATGIVFIQLNGYIVRSAKREFARQLRDTLESSDKDLAVEGFAGWMRSRLESY